MSQVYFCTLYKRYFEFWDISVNIKLFFTKKFPIFQGISILELFYFINKICGRRSNTDILALIYFHWIELKIRYDIHHILLPKN